MIDTIKVGIPLSKTQHSKLYKRSKDSENWQWVQLHPKSGELRYVRVRGLAEVDQNSFHREIRWDIPNCYRDNDTYLTVELSLPKFTYGHNIRLLYGWIEALKDLKKQFEKQLHCKFSDVMCWKVTRVDPCYTWQCPSQDTAQNLLNSLKRLSFPYKKPIIYNTSISFPGNTYSLKFYLKLPEFRANDMKALVKNKASLEWVNWLENIATGIIRFEATLRQKYLKRKGIETIADLVKPVTQVEWKLDEEVENFQPHAAIYTVLLYQQTKGLNLIQNIENGIETTLSNGMSFSAPKLDLELNGRFFHFPGGSFTYRKHDNLVITLQYFLEKFLGKNRGMDEQGQVKDKLLKKYKATKATRLLGFWMHVQRFGIQDAKEMYGKHPFYRNKADLKVAEISLVEPDLVTNLDEKFVESFKFEVPSMYVGNQFDDFKDQSNLLNEKLDADT